MSMNILSQENYKLMQFYFNKDNKIEFLNVLFSSHSYLNLTTIELQTLLILFESFNTSRQFILSEEDLKTLELITNLIIKIIRFGIIYKKDGYVETKELLNFKETNLHFYS